MLSSLETFIILFYLFTIVMTTVIIAIVNPGAVIRERIEAQETNEKFVQAEFEEPSSESEQSESEEEYKMEENPMFRRRHVAQPEQQTEQKEEVPWIEQVD